MLNHHLTLSLNRPDGSHPLLILEPCLNAAWEIRRRDVWRGEAILQALCRLMFLWNELGSKGGKCREMTTTIGELPKKQNSSPGK